MTQVRNESGGNLIQKLRFALFFTRGFAGLPCTCASLCASSRLGSNRLVRRRVRPDDENLQLRNYN